MQGHIYRRGKQSWGIVISLGRDPVSGKRKQLTRSVKGRKADAEKLLVELLHQKETGIAQAPAKLTVGDFLVRWLDDYARPNTAPKTFQRYEGIVRNQIIPALGSVPLSKLRPQHLQRLYADLLENGRSDGQGGLSAKSVRHVHQVARTALTHAVRWQELARNPAADVEPPRPERYEPRVLSVEQVRSLLDYAGQTKLKTFVYVAIMSGARRGELLGLRWQDVDLDGGVMRIRQAANWLPGRGFVLSQPKTHRSRRPIALGAATVEVLREHRRGQVEQRLALGGWPDHDLVFTNEAGGPLDPANLRRDWLRVLEVAGLAPLRLHDLRHASATLLLVQGVHPRVVAERLGHADTSTTMNIYSHVLPHLQEQAAISLERLLSSG